MPMKDFDLLGKMVKDRVTGAEGVVTSMSYDLYGCIQAVVTPFTDKEGKPQDGRWFDTKRLMVTDHVPVMEIPDFENPPGGQDLPSQDR